MYIKVNFNNFYDAFMLSDDCKNHFSYKGLRALYEYIEELEDELDERIELDIVALCSDYAEYTLEDFNRDFETNYKIDEIEKDERFLVHVKENTFLIRNI